jgi:hypothetical protein
LDYLTSMCDGKPTGKPGPHLRLRSVEARKTDLGGERSKWAENRLDDKNAGLSDRRSWRLTQQGKCLNLKKVAGSTRLELATSGVTGRRSNQLNYDPVRRPLLNTEF